MSHPDITAYVADARRRGLKPDAARKAMHVFGWSDAEIDAAFREGSMPARAKQREADATRHLGVTSPLPPVKRDRRPLLLWLALAAVALGLIVAPIWLLF